MQGYWVYLFHGTESRYHPDLPPGVERVGLFLTRSEARAWLADNWDGQMDYQIAGKDEPVWRCRIAGEKTVDLLMVG